MAETHLHIFTIQPRVECSCMRQLSSFLNAFFSFQFFFLIRFFPRFRLVSVCLRLHFASFSAAHFFSVGHWSSMRLKSFYLPKYCLVYRGTFRGCHATTATTTSFPLTSTWQMLIARKVFFFFVLLAYLHSSCVWIHIVACASLFLVVIFRDALFTRRFSLSLSLSFLIRFFPFASFCLLTVFFFRRILFAAHSIVLCVDDLNAF